MLSTRRKFDKNLASIIQLLHLAEHVAESTSVPFMKGIFGTVAFIAETAQSVQRNKEDCQALAQRAANLAFGLEQQLLEHKSRMLTIYMQRNLQRLSCTLEEIKEFMMAQSNRSWLNGLKNLDEISSQVQQYTTKLDDATRLFQIGSIINIEILILKLTEELYHLRGEQESKLFEIDAMLKASSDRGENGIKHFWDNDIDLKSNPTALDRLEMPGTDTKHYHGEINGRAVTVRYYPSGEGKRFEKDLNDFLWFKQFFHPNIAQFLGRSHPRSKHHFLVVRSGIISVKECLKSASGVQRLALAIPILTQIYSGHAYLEDRMSDFRWHNYENAVLLDNLGQVFLGNDAHPSRVDGGGILSTNIRSVLHGEEPQTYDEGADPDYWKVFGNSFMSDGHEPAHVRYLGWKAFASYFSQLDWSSSLLEIPLANRLCLITLWADIVRKSSGLNDAKSPTRPSDVAVHVGDIAIRGPLGRFVKVDSIFDSARQLLYSCRHEDVTRKRDAGCRYLFDSSCIEAVVEGANTEYTLFPTAGDLAIVATRFYDQPQMRWNLPIDEFFTFSSRIFTLAHALGREPHDFILVTAVTASHLCTLEWNANEEPPPVARFRTNPPNPQDLNNNWGNWCVCDLDVPMGATTLADCSCIRSHDGHQAFQVKSESFADLTYIQLTRSECTFLASLGWPFPPQTGEECSDDASSSVAEDKRLGL